MPNTNPNTEINVDVSIEPDGDTTRFSYASTNQVDENGNVDLSGLPRGTVRLRFRLQTTEINLNGEAHKLGFVADDGIWITSARHGNPTGPYRREGILECLYLSKPQFHDCATVGDGGEELRLLNRNTSGKEYKYTLRVQAAGPQGTRTLEHDPRIKNRGGGFLSQR